MEKLLKLKDVLVNAEDYSFRDSLYLTMDKNWNLNSDCAVLNSDDLETDEEDPKFALENGLIYALGIHDVQDIVINAKEQNLNCTGEDLLQAFLFYYNNDAFIDFSK
jgi:hypothetical protein